MAMRSADGDKAAIRASIRALLDALDRRGVAIRLDAKGRAHLAPAARLEPAELALLRQHRDVVIAILSEDVTPRLKRATWGRRNRAASNVVIVKHGQSPPEIADIDPYVPRLNRRDRHVMRARSEFAERLIKGRVISGNTLNE